MMIGKDRIQEVLKQELQGAIDIDRGLDGGSRQMAIDYYFGQLPGNDTAQPKDSPTAVAEDPNRGAVSLDVADMTEAVCSQLLPALEQPGAIEFEAMGPDDEAQAQRESAIVRSVIMEGRAGEGGFVALTEGVKDALLMRTGVMALWVQRRETVTPEEWEDVPEMAVGELVSPNAPGQRVQRVSVERDDEAQGAGDETQEASGPLYRVKLERVDTDKRLVLAAVPRESYVTSNAESRDANEARFSADRMVKTRSDWIADGLPEREIAALPAFVESGDDGYLERARSTGWSEGAQAAQKATDLVELWRCYAILSEAEGSSTGRRYRVYFSRVAGEVVGEPEPVGRVCYALGVTTIFPHRLEGVSLWDSIAEIQELKSKALRNWAENLHKVNRPRLGVDENLVNLADAYDATQDIVRMRGPGAMVPVPVTDAGPSVLSFLNFCDQARSERGGASLDMQAGAIQVATNQTASGIERQYSTKESRAAMMARTFAETGMRQVWLAAHYLLRTQWGGKIAAKVGGEWIEDDPTKWRARSGVIVHVGESRTQAAMRGQVLQQVMMAQAQLSQAGKVGILTDDKRMFNAFTDWCFASHLRAPERYFIDPESQQAQQAAQAQGQAQQQAQQAAMASQRAAMMLEKYKVDQSSLTDLIDTMVKAAIEEAKLTLMPAALEEAQAIAGEAAGQAQARSGEAEAAAGGAGA